MTRSIMSLGALVGPPISGAINSKTGGFEAVGYYAGMLRKLGSVSMLTFWTGSAILVGVGLMLASRYYALKGFYRENVRERGTCIFISTIKSVGIRAAHATNPDSTLCFGHESYTDQVYELVYER